MNTFMTHFAVKYIQFFSLNFMTYKSRVSGVFCDLYIIYN